MSPIKFGTDGWRAIMDKEFTFENVELVAQAFSDYLRAEKTQKGAKNAPAIVIGYDYRKNSENYAKSFAEVLNANGIKVLLSSQACPTPAVSFSIVDQSLDAGIVITASHNPAGYNGIKIKTDFGGSAEKAITEAVEKWIGKNPVRKKPFTAENPTIVDLNQKYLEFLNFPASTVLIFFCPQAPLPA